MTTTTIATLLLWLTCIAYGVGRAATVLDWPAVASAAFAVAWVVGCAGAPVVLGGFIDAVGAARGAKGEGQ